MKKGPIKPSHQWQILPAQQSLLITANSWRSFQRGLYQGQEHLDLNYPWHNVWPFCYHWGGQHLLRGHGPRGHWGYQGQQCKLSAPPHCTPYPTPSNSHFAIQLQLGAPIPLRTMKKRDLTSPGAGSLQWCCWLSSRLLSAGEDFGQESWALTCRRSGASADKRLEVIWANLQTSTILLHLPNYACLFYSGE